LVCKKLKPYNVLNEIQVFSAVLLTLNNLTDDDEGKIITMKYFPYMIATVAVLRLLFEE